ncbi:MAG TPA: Uma2 family endonuclease [Gemmataceae bacterium]|jgi:Uma2 family endonuclease|nr:Uma2 family endonuclease [Gemmataceae bacterium]
MATVHAPSDQRFVLPGVSWRTYERLLRAFADRPGVRLTYDRGTLELMTLSHEHESLNYLLARLIDALTEELALPVKGGRSTTFRRRKRRRGLGPDSCWWIASEPLVRGKTEIDLRRDPPPDLGLEIDVTHSSLNRLAIYAALRVPEVWRLEGHTIVCYLLGSDGRYTTAAVSLAFPGLTVADLAAFLPLRGQMDENAVVRQFRTWVRQRFPSAGSAQPSP